jgi:molybdopterin-binding protein
LESTQHFPTRIVEHHDDRIEPISAAISDKVLSEIIVETAIGDVAAIITTRSVQGMGLKVGDKVAALVKATNVSLRRQV